MSKSSLPSYSDIDTTNELFDHLSISFDNKKFLQSKHIASKPKLKRLVKIKSSPIVNSTTFCIRCKKETLFANSVDDTNRQNASEKEVEVKKELIGNACEKRINFAKDDFSTKGDIKQKADKTVKILITRADGDDGTEPRKDTGGSSSFPESESLPVHFQSSFFPRRPSIIGNNEFWLPSYSSCEAPLEEQVAGSDTASLKMITKEPEELKTPENECNVSLKDVDGVLDDSDGLTVFLNNIFKKTSRKQVRILQVASMLDEALAVLTDEYFFKCTHNADTYEIIEVISLKDVQKIMVSDTCALLVLEVCHASSMTEFKEFVPGYSEKTETLISLMVYAISRIKSFLLDVARLPFLTLPTCEVMHNWLVRQNEEIIYTGIATAENISDPDYEDLADESFMMKTSEINQFHPVLLLLRSGYLTSKCNGGCASRGCKYSTTFELKKEKVIVMRREDKPWPNCVRLITECKDITFAGSRKSCVDDLMEKLYCCTRSMTDQRSTKFNVFVLVTQHSLQFFKMTLDKTPVFGSPLLNLEIFDEETGGMTCIIDSQGTEVDDLENLHIQNRWHLKFLNENEKLRFLTATSIE